MAILRRRSRSLRMTLPVGTMLRKGTPSPDDLPLFEKGGRVKVYWVFRMELEEVLEELNQELVTYGNL